MTAETFKSVKSRSHDIKFPLVTDWKIVAFYQKKEGFVPEARIPDLSVELSELKEREEMASFFKAMLLLHCCRSKWSFSKAFVFCQRSSSLSNRVSKLHAFVVFKKLFPH